MPENRTRQLINDALGAIDEPYGENITDKVLGVIENSELLLDEYHAIAAGFEGGIGSLNQNIGYFVRKITSRRVLPRRYPCKRNCLAKTYSKLVD